MAYITDIMCSRCRKIYKGVRCSHEPPLCSACHDKEEKKKAGRKKKIIAAFKAKTTEDKIQIMFDWCSYSEEFMDYLGVRFNVDKHQGAPWC